MPITKEEIEEARQADKSEKRQRQMEKEIYGEPLPLPKPGKQESPSLLPGKGKKEKFGEGATKYAKGGAVGSASKRADGVAQRGKTKGKFV